MFNCCRFEGLVVRNIWFRGEAVALYIRVIGEILPAILFSTQSENWQGFGDGGDGGWGVPSGAVVDPSGKVSNGAWVGFRQFTAKWQFDTQ